MRKMTLVANTLKETSLFYSIADGFKHTPVMLSFQMVDNDGEKVPALVIESCWKNEADQAQQEKENEEHG